LSSSKATRGSEHS